LPSKKGLKLKQIATEKYEDHIFNVGIHASDTDHPGAKEDFDFDGFRPDDGDPEFWNN